MSVLVKRILVLIITSIVVVVLYFSFIRLQNSFNIMPGSNKVVIIDAGHGGRDPGASGKTGVTEKDINLEIAKKIKEYIEENGGVAVMIREEDNGLYSVEGKNKKREDMKNRKQIIKDSHADMLISIHLNSFPESRYYGAQVFYFKGSNDSEYLAKIIQKEMIKVLDRNNDRAAKSTDTYFILKDNDIPSVLIECGFLSNPEEEMLLNTPEYQNKIAWSIYTGIIKYFAEPVPENSKTGN